MKSTQSPPTIAESKRHLQLGANYLGARRCSFQVWAPCAQEVELHILGDRESYIALNHGEKGYFETQLEDISPGTLYKYRLNSRDEYPDPASQYQPEGVLGPSQVVDPAFNWEDTCWYGHPLKDYIIYELHVGTYTRDGTFEAIIPHLPELRELGITALELMPIAQFPGHRNWGYDGAYPFAVQNSYGGVNGLKRLVNACHQEGLSVILDVVYNHLGPEGCYMGQFGHYYTERYKTNWGQALNFDGPHSDEVRRFFIENAIYWETEFHIDALRLDAVHAILDFSPQPFIEEMGIAVKAQAEKLNRRVYLMAESDSNDARLVRPRNLGGYGLDAQWNDDFHHALHVLLTGENVGYYQSYNNLQSMAKALEDGFIFSGQYSPFREHRWGSSSRDIPPYRLIVFAQNHDQIGNRMLGDRLSHLVSLDSLKLTAAMVLLSPFIPLLFMGEEFGEVAHFPYFVSHSDPGLVESVRQGRKAEFASFHAGEPPDPQSERTFREAKLNHELKEEGPHRVIREFYKELIRLRREVSSLSNLSKDDLEVLGNVKQNLLLVRRRTEDSECLCGFNFSDRVASMVVPVPEGNWRKLIDSSEERWRGTGSSIPGEVFSDGELNLSLNPRSMILLVK